MHNLYNLLCCHIFSQFQYKISPYFSPFLCHITLSRGHALKLEIIAYIGHRFLLKSTGHFVLNTIFQEWNSAGTEWTSIWAFFVRSYLHQYLSTLKVEMLAYIWQMTILLNFAFKFKFEWKFLRLEFSRNRMGQYSNATSHWPCLIFPRLEFTWNRMGGGVADYLLCLFSVYVDIANKKQIS